MTFTCARSGKCPDPAHIKHHPTGFWIKLSAMLNVVAGAAYIWWRATRSMPEDPIRCSLFGVVLERERERACKNKERGGERGRGKPSRPFEDHVVSGGERLGVALLRSGRE